MRLLIHRLASYTFFAVHMRSVIARGKERLVRVVWPPETRCVTFHGIALPPAALRRCGADFSDDSYFVQSAVDEADRIKTLLGLRPTSRLLEIGCGPGRTAIGLLCRGYSIGRFDGIDVDKRSVDWCKTFISWSHPQYNFWTVDAKNERYNPRGTEMTWQFSLPFDSGVFDIIYLHSVFTNMSEKDVRIYTKEFRRLLAPMGKVFLTAFVEDDVPSVTINPQNYVLKCQGPLHVVRYQREHLFSIFASSRLEVERFEHGNELSGESGVYLRQELSAISPRAPS